LGGVLVVVCDRYVTEILVAVDVGEGLRGVVSRGRRRELMVGLDNAPDCGTVAAGEEPASMMVRRADCDVWVVGGRLPDQATGAWVRNARGDLVAGRCAGEAWLVAVEQPRGLGEQPPLLYRDAAGNLVPRALGRRLIAVTDTAVPCPACQRVE